MSLTPVFLLIPALPLLPAHLAPLVGPRPFSISCSLVATALTAAPASPPVYPSRCPRRCCPRRCLPLLLRIRLRTPQLLSPLPRRPQTSLTPPEVLGVREGGTKSSIALPPLLPPLLLSLPSLLSPPLPRPTMRPSSLALSLPPLPTPLLPLPTPSPLSRFHNFYANVKKRSTALTVS